MAAQLQHGTTVCPVYDLFTNMLGVCKEPEPIEALAVVFHLTISYFFAPSVSASSEAKGKGTQFTIRLPLHEVTNNKQVKQLPSYEKPSRTLRIL